MNILGVYDYGGHYGRSEWSNLNMFDIFSTFDINDSMHDGGGIVKAFWEQIGKKTKKKLVELDKYIKLTKETTGRFGKKIK